MGQLKFSGFNVRHDDYSDNNDIVIINTCGFINDAKEESINTILEFSELKKAGRISELYVMGCLSERYKKELSEELPEVDQFFGVYQFNDIISTLGGKFRKELIGERVLTQPSHFAYLKISEGCDRTCSFCAIPLIKGKHKSRSKPDIIEEAVKLRDKGVKELILISQDLTYYGLDIEKKRLLPELVHDLANITGIEWIRLHYAYPSGFPMKLLDVMSANSNVCKYIDIPLQHISDRILKSMKRGINTQETIDLIKNIRNKIPGITLRTSFIVGYPGETEKEFLDLIDFVRTQQFERVGVFKYSHEEGTDAYSLMDNIPEEVKNHRAEELMSIQEEISYGINQRKIGSVCRVIIDSEEREHYIGRTEFDSPEVDNEVLINKKVVLNQGEFYKVKIVEAASFDLTGEIIID